VFGDTYHSNVHRPLAEREALRSSGERVQILRVHGFVFFGTASGLLERIRKRIEGTELRFLLLDLRRVTGVDSSAVVSFRKIVSLAEANGFELVFTDVSDDVRKQLTRGEIVASDGVVRFEPDLDRGLQRCEDELLEGLADPVDGGEVLVYGRPVRISRPRDALEAGVVLVPEDRKLQGLVMTGSVAFNLALPWTRRWNPSFFPDRHARAAIVGRAIRGFGIKVSDPEQPVGGLSGGNQQKVLVGRWMEERPKVLILDEPTRGVDVGAREEMFAVLARLVQEGMAVLMISSDLTEVMNMSHRLALYRDGRIVGMVDPRAASAEDVMHRLTGGAAS